MSCKDEQGSFVVLENYKEKTQTMLFSDLKRLSKTIGLKTAAYAYGGSVLFCLLFHDYFIHIYSVSFFIH